MSKARLAKITRPRLHGILARERLFRLLDDERRHRPVWRSAAPGARQRALIANYLETRKLPGVWCQKNSSDSDPSTFFIISG